MTIEEALAASEAEPVTDDDMQFWVDEHLRVISIPKNGVVAGVEGDKNVNKIKFRMNRYYHGFDMSEFSGRILYSNAKGNKNYYNITDMQESGSTITFSWLVDADAVQYMGKTAFVVYLFKTQGSELRQKFYSTLATLNVLEGMEVDSAVPVEKQTDIIERMKEEISAYAEEIKKSLPADYTAMTEQVSSLKEDLSQLSEEMANAGSGMTATVKNALLNCFANVAWANENGQTYYNALQTALNESVGEIKLSSITATCSETAQVGTAASDLDIVVTAVYSDGSSAQVTGWTTSGTVVEGTNTFVVSYGGKNTTVTVTGVDLYYVLNNVTNKSVNMSSNSYSDGGETVAGFPNTFQPWHFFGSKVVEQDTAVKIKYIPSATNYNGMFAYCVNPETFTTTQKKYYAVKLVDHYVVDTTYEWEYTIKAGYAFGISLGSDSPVPTVEVVS